LLEGFVKIDLGNRVLTQQAKLAAMSNRIQMEIKTLQSMEALSKLGVSFEGKVEKKLKEKCLEAVEYGWMTAKEVCREVYPLLVGGSLEDKRAVKSVSMCLMRLSDSKREKLVNCDRNGKEYRYRILPNGIKKLFFYREERARIERKKLLRESIESIVKLNEELVPEIEKARTCHSDALAILENTYQSRYFQSKYGGIVIGLTRQIIAFQQAMIKDDYDLRITALKQSTDYLLQLCEFEVQMTEALLIAYEEQKWLKSQIAQRDRELEGIQGKT